jgi:hypothetical protein
MRQKAVGMSDFISKEFKTYAFTGEWAAQFGEPETNFSVLVFGHRKQGKTEYCVKLSKYLAGFGKVYYNSFEQGYSKSLQDALKRNDMLKVAGKVIVGIKETVPQMMSRLKQRNSARFIIIDSRDYINLTAAQYRELREAFPRKAIIIICWETSGKPAGKHAQDISYMVDAIVHVRDFVAHPTSRFGGNEKFIIWNRRAEAGSQLALTL